MRSTRCRTTHDPVGRKACGQVPQRGVGRDHFVEIIVIRLCVFVAMAALLLVMLLLGADLGLASTTVALLGGAASQMAAPNGYRSRPVPAPSR